MTFFLILFTFYIYKVFSVRNLCKYGNSQIFLNILFCLDRIIHYRKNYNNRRTCYKSEKETDFCIFLHAW